jgi:hypothetical protein
MRVGSYARSPNVKEERQVELGLGGERDLDPAGKVAGSDREALEGAALPSGSGVPPGRAT